MFMKKLKKTNKVVASEKNGFFSLREEQISPLSSVLDKIYATVFFIVLFKKRYFDFSLKFLLPMFCNICHKTFHLCPFLSKNGNNSAFREKEENCGNVLETWPLGTAGAKSVKFG